MNGRRSKKLRAELIEMLGKSPTPHQWRMWKKACRHGEELSPARREEIKRLLMNRIAERKPAPPAAPSPIAVPEGRPFEARITIKDGKVIITKVSWWQRFKNAIRRILKGRSQK